MAKPVDDAVMSVAQCEVALAAAHKAVFDAQQVENAAQAALASARADLSAKVDDQIKKSKP